MGLRASSLEPDFGDIHAAILTSPYRGQALMIWIHKCKVIIVARTSRALGLCIAFPQKVYGQGLVTGNEYSRKQVMQPNHSSMV